MHCLKQVAEFLGNPARQGRNGLQLFGLKKLSFQFLFFFLRLLTLGNILTNTDQSDWTASLSFNFRPPRRLIRTRPQIRTSMRFNSSKRVICLIPLGGSECRTVSDSRRQQIDMQMDTGLSEMLRGGAIFSYVLNDLRHTSDRLSQYTFRVFLDLRLFAGEIR